MSGHSGSRHLGRQVFAAVTDQAGGLCALVSREYRQVMCHHRRPDVGLKMIQALPGTTTQPVTALKTGDTRFDTRTEVS